MQAPGKIGKGIGRPMIFRPVNGCYMGGELALDDQRFEMLLRLLNGWHLRVESRRRHVGCLGKSHGCRLFLQGAQRLENWQGRGRVGP